MIKEDYEGAITYICHVYWNFAYWQKVCKLNLENYLRFLTNYAMKTSNWICKPCHKSVFSNNGRHSEV